MGGAGKTESGGGAGLTAWAAASSVALLAALAWPALAGRVYAGDDLGAFHLPLRWFYWNALRNGDAFDWLPGLFCGFYLTGEGQAGTWHPLHLLLYRWLDFPVAFNLEVFASYPLMFAGMVVLLLRPGLGIDPRPGPARAPLYAALFGAMTFTFSASCMMHFMHVNGIAVVAHLPWLLLAIDIGVRDEGRRRRRLAWCAAAMLVASQCLCGHPQYVWICAVAATAWASMAGVLLEGSTRRGWREWKGIAYFAAAAALGALIGSVQLLPTWDHLGHSQRLQWDDAANVAPLHPVNLAQLVGPYLFRDRVDTVNTAEFAAYAGAVPLLLVFWMFVQEAETGGRRRATTAIGIFGVVAFVMALGHYGGLYTLQTYLPVVGSFRASARYLLLVHLAIAMLAAAALARLAAWSPGTAKARSDVGWKLALFSAAVALELHVTMDAGRVGTVAGALVGPALLSLAAVLLAAALRGWRPALALLVVLTAADLGSYGMSFLVWPASAPLEELLAGLPTASGTGRIATLQPQATGSYTGNALLMRGWHLSDGYAALMPASVLPAGNLGTLRLQAVEKVWRMPGPMPIEGLRPLDSRWYAVPDPMPRVRLASRAVVSTDPATDLEALPAAEAAQTAFVAQPVDVGGTVGKAELLRDRPGDIEVRADAPHQQLLVVAERFHEGWKARVDGRATSSLRVDGDMLGVLVPEGRSDVSLVFDPDSLRYGKLLSCAGLALWSLMFVAALRCPREQRARSAGEAA
ncbi:MAG TPA: hypothetical protein VGK20_06410 [Candidatus Binatia bacterium]